jgi:opacity protein-like surface antigen
MSATGSNAVLVANGSGFSYGAGLQYNLSSTIYLTADYMSYYSATGVTVAGPAGGVGMKF